MTGSARKCEEIGDIMDRNDYLRDFFDSPFAEDYISCMDLAVRHSVTGISASCELLRELAEKHGTASDRELIDGIMTMCCELMRNAELSRALTAAPAEVRAGSCILRTDTFLSDFAKNCERASSGRCSITLSGSPVLYIRTGRELLSFMLLSFIRRRLTAAPGGRAEFELSCAERNGSAEIKLSCLTDVSEDDLIGQPELLSEYPAEMTARLAERLGVSAETGSSSLLISIPLPDGVSPAVVELPAPAAEETFFNPFNIMLRDMR